MGLDSPGWVFLAIQPRQWWVTRSKRLWSVIKNNQGTDDWKYTHWKIIVFGFRMKLWFMWRIWLLLIPGVSSSVTCREIRDTGQYSISLFNTIKQIIHIKVIRSTMLYLPFMGELWHWKRAQRNSLPDENISAFSKTECAHVPSCVRFFYDYTGL